MCKAVDETSVLNITQQIRDTWFVSSLHRCGCGGTGRRARLKIWFPKGVSVRFRPPAPFKSNPTFLSILVSGFVVSFLGACVWQLLLLNQPIATPRLFCLLFLHKVTPEQKCAGMLRKCFQWAAMAERFCQIYFDIVWKSPVTSSIDKNYKTVRQSLYRTSETTKREFKTIYRKEGR